MKWHLKFSQPYLNRKLKHFERKVLTPAGDWSIFTPLVFDSKRNMWFGKHISSGDDPGSTTTYTSIRIKDLKFGNWYRKKGYMIVGQLWADEEAERLKEIEKELPKKKIEFEEAGGANLSKEEISMLQSLRFVSKAANKENEILDALVKKKCLVREGLFRKIYVITSNGKKIVDYLDDKAQLKAKRKVVASTN